MQPHNYSIVHIGTSQYGTYRVVDMAYHGRPARMLFGADGSPQSGMAKDNEPELLFDYNQRFLEMMLSQPPRKMLVIGGGVMMLPKAAYQRFPKLNLDVVEHDELLVQLARDYFELPHSPRLRTHIADGLEFVKSARTTYDIIILDAFNGYVVPPHLIDAEAARHYQKILSAKGLIAINFISAYNKGEPSLAHDMIASFSRHFKHLKIYQSDPEDEHGREQNMLLVASHTERALDYLQTEEITL